MSSWGLAGCVFVGVLWSYLISYVRDVRDFHRQGISVLRAIKRAKSPLLVSVVLRATFVAGVVQAVVLAFPARGVLGWTSPILAGLAVHWPAAVLPYLHGKIAEQRRFNGMARTMLRFERHTWRAVLFELEFLQSEAFNELWNRYADKAPILTLFEEKKLVIIRYFYAKREAFGDNLWLHYGLICGDRDSRRIEALVHVFGVREVGAEIERLRAGRASAHWITTDKRVYPRDAWTDPDFVLRLEGSKRPAERVLAEYIRFEQDRPATRGRRHTKRRPIPRPKA